MRDFIRDLWRPTILVVIVTGAGIAFVLARADARRYARDTALCRSMYGRAATSTDSLLVDGFVVSTNGWGGYPTLCAELRDK